MWFFRKEECFLKFLDKEQNGPFTNLLGAPAILLGAPGMTLEVIIRDVHAMGLAGVQAKKLPHCF